MSNAAIELSNSLASVVETCGAGVVRVEGRRRWPSSGAVWSADGVIVTADHALEQDEDLGVVLPDGRELEASLVGRDHGTDLAVLRVAASGLAVPAWGELDGLKVGHLVVAVSRPGRTARAAAGVVAALGEGSWRTPAGGKVDRYLEPDLGLRPGFSGSVLADASGRVLGLNTSGLVRGTPVTLPTATVRRVVAAVLAHGHVRRGFVGVGAQTVRLSPALEKLAGQESGLLLASIERESPAERAGLLQGDVLVAFAGEPVKEVGDLLALLDEERIGAEATAKVFRGGEARELKVTVGSEP